MAVLQKQADAEERKRAEEREFVQTKLTINITAERLLIPAPGAVTPHALKQVSMDQVRRPAQQMPARPERWGMLNRSDNLISLVRCPSAVS